ncbi:MAG: heme-binding protein [Chloroflexota bacterium]|nr:heme-binding protein [Chloroflexota bacterium]
MTVAVEKAMQLIQAAHAEAESIDLAVTAVVVDEGGRLIALGRMDGARPITVDIAMNKAYTAASFQQSTAELAGVAGQAWFQSLIVSSNGRVTAGGGAIPIVEAGNVVGALAVAGGTDEQDQRCCDAALRRYG